MLVVFLLGGLVFIGGWWLVGADYQRQETNQERTLSLQTQVTNLGQRIDSLQNSGQSEEEKKKREEIRTGLGRLLAEGRAVMNYCLNPPQPAALCGAAAEKWYQGATKYIQQTLEPSYLSRFVNASGNSMTYTGAAAGTDPTLNGVAFRCAALEQFIEELLR